MIATTIYTDLEKLYNSGEEEASLIIQLMITSNDITLRIMLHPNLKMAN